MTQITKLLVASIIIWSLCRISIFGQSSNWTEIKPLVSTEREVIKLLGDRYKKTENGAWFETEEGSYFVRYFLAGCKLRTDDGAFRDLAESVVESFYFKPKEVFSLENYVGDTGKFIGRQFPPDSNRTIYSSPDSKVSIEIINRSDQSSYVSLIEVDAGNDRGKVVCPQNVEC